jgi:hypothetical protein
MQRKFTYVDLINKLKNMENELNNTYIPYIDFCIS